MKVNKSMIKQMFRAQSAQSTTTTTTQSLRIARAARATLSIMSKQGYPFAAVTVALSLSLSHFSVPTQTSFTYCYIQMTSDLNGSGKTASRESCRKAVYFRWMCHNIALN